MLDNVQFCLIIFKKKKIINYFEGIERKEFNPENILKSIFSKKPCPDNILKIIFRKSFVLKNFLKNLSNEFRL